MKYQLLLNSSLGNYFKISYNILPQLIPFYW